MATASKAAALQTALLSVRSLRRRKLGHISPTHYPHNGLDKWGRKNTNNNGNGMPSNLLAGGGGGRRPAPRASLVFGGEKRNSLRRRNNVTLNNGCSNTSSTTNGIHINRHSSSNKASTMNMNRINGKRLHSSRRYVNGSSQQLQAVINGGGSTQHANSNSNQSTSSKKDRQTKNKSDLIVVLDMDECLIHSQFLSDVDKYRQAEERPSSSSTSTSDASTSQSTFEPGGGQHSPSDSLFLNACDSFRITLPDGDLVNVNKRPNLDLFLKEITNKFETYIFTAAMEVSLYEVIRFGRLCMNCICYSF